MSISRRELILLSVCHLLVDGVCAAALFRNEGVTLTGAITIYTTLAFTTQCITGLIPDRYGRGREFVLLSAVMLLAGIMLPVPLYAQAVIIGLGNSLFHVSGGYLTLKGSTTMGPLGAFVAPGAIGLFLGTVFPVLCIPFALVLLAISAVLVFAERKDARAAGASDPAAGSSDHSAVTSHPSAGARGISDNERIVLAAMLLVAVAARAVGGSAVVFPWKTGLAAGVVMTLAVFAGKFFGGYIADRAGIRLTAVCSVVFASVLIVLCNKWMIPSLAGQFALNLSMPVTLYLIYRLFPDSPGFAFGLAASALWPGTLAGKLIHLTGVWAGLLAVICFAAGLAAVLTAERSLRNEEDEAIIHITDDGSCGDMYSVR